MGIVCVSLGVLLNSLHVIKQLARGFLSPPLLLHTIPPFFFHTPPSVLMIDECITKQ